ncbi:hypothetical protein [Pontibacter beigongshangensis]|nr:hypothetical protein [Pontibacter beigongshangensis]
MNKNSKDLAACAAPKITLHSNYSNEKAPPEMLLPLMLLLNE